MHLGDHPCNHENLFHDFGFLCPWKIMFLQSLHLCIFSPWRVIVVHISLYWHSRTKHHSITPTRPSSPATRPTVKLRTQSGADLFINNWYQKLTLSTRDVESFLIQWQAFCIDDKRYKGVNNEYYVVTKIVSDKTVGIQGVSYAMSFRQHTLNGYTKSCEFITDLSLTWLKIVTKRMNENMLIIF